MEPGRIYHPANSGNNKPAQNPSANSPKDDQPSKSPPTPPPDDPPAVGHVRSEDSPVESAAAEAPLADTDTTPAEEQAEQETPRSDQPLTPETTENTSEPSGDSPPPPQDKNQASAANDMALYSWEAAEYTQHERSLGWYLILGVVTLGFLALLILVFQEWLTAVVVMLMAIAVYVYSHRPPRTLRYVLSEGGLQIGQKFYPYDDFRGFAVVTHDSLPSIELDPMRRFMPRLSLYSDKKDQAKIVDILEQRLPRNDRQPDPIDRLSHYLKF